MKRLFLLLAFFGTLWSDTFVWTPVKTSKGPSAHGPQGKMHYMISGADHDMNLTALYIDSRLEAQPLTVEEAQITLPKSLYNNYHALVAKAQNGNRHYSSITYLYQFGRPSQHSPKELTDLSKATFEIIPSPLPREHDRYTASKRYRFELHFQGKPLQVPVILTTSNGNRTTLRSDANGHLDVTLPNDFTDVKTGRNSNASATFTLWTSHQDGSESYETSLTQSYAVNPNDFWRSEPFGAAVALLGFGLGLFFYPRKKHG